MDMKVIRRYVGHAGLYRRFNIDFSKISRPLTNHLQKDVPFGLCNAPATFQRCMTAIFSDFCEKIVEVFMDDFSVYGTSFDDRLSNLDRVL